jgi:hypothetical protein
MIRAHVPGSARTVLIFRLGSLGDTVVALPSFRLIARSFPAARRVVLTNVPRSAQETDLDAVLAGTGLVHGYMHYDPADRSASTAARVRREIRTLAPDALIYLVEHSSRLRMLRHLAFFVSCGVAAVLGMPEFGAEGVHGFDPATGLWESEAAFLLRRLRVLDRHRSTTRRSGISHSPTRSAPPPRPRSRIFRAAAISSPSPPGPRLTPRTGAKRIGSRSRRRCRRAIRRSAWSPSAGRQTGRAPRRWRRSGKGRCATSAGASPRASAPWRWGRRACWRRTTAGRCISRPLSARLAWLCSARARSLGSGFRVAPATGCCIATCPAPAAASRSAWRSASAASQG